MVKHYNDIGEAYSSAKLYNTSKENHMMKNSKWGAVAYLTHNQYGRNGYTLYVNNGTSTGNSSDSIDPNSYKDEYTFDTPEGQKASRTGNIYGVYDLSFDDGEYVAVFNSSDTNNYKQQYGSSFALANASDKYAIYT